MNVLCYVVWFALLVCFWCVLYVNHVFVCSPCELLYDGVWFVFVLLAVVCVCFCLFYLSLDVLVCFVCGVMRDVV